MFTPELTGTNGLLDGDSTLTYQATSPLVILQ